MTGNNHLPITNFIKSTITESTGAGVILQNVGYDQNQYAVLVSSYINSKPVLAEACQNPAEQAKLREALLKCMNAGLVPNGKEVYLDAWRSKTGGLTITTIFMKDGLLKLCARAGYHIDAIALRESQKPVKKIINGKEVFEFAETSAFDNSPIIGYLATAHDIKTGEMVKEMAVSMADVNKRKNASRSKDSGPWKDWPDEMAKKTAIRMIANSLAGLDKSQFDDGDYEDVNPSEPPAVKVAPEKVRVVGNQSPAPAPAPAHDPVDVNINEITPPPQADMPMPITEPDGFDRPADIPNETPYFQLVRGLIDGHNDGKILTDMAKDNLEVINGLGDSLKNPLRSFIGYAKILPRKIEIPNYIDTNTKLSYWLGDYAWTYATIAKLAKIENVPDFDYETNTDKFIGEREQIKLRNPYLGDVLMNEISKLANKFMS